MEGETGKYIGLDYEITDFDTLYQVAWGQRNNKITYGMHIHSVSYELYLILGGNADYLIDGERRHVSRGDFLVIQPGMIHRPYFVNGSPYERVLIQFSEKLLREYSITDSSLYGYFKQEKQHFYHMSEEELKEYVDCTERMMEIQADQGELGWEVVSRSMLNILIVLAARKIQKTEASECDGGVLEEKCSPQLRAAIRYINEHYFEDISVETVAKEVNLSTSYLSSIFKKYMGNTLWNYVLSKRLVLAEKYILEGSTITEACYESGFRDYAHFIKSFHKTFGMSPQKLRDSKNASLP